MVPPADRGKPQQRGVRDIRVDRIQTLTFGRNDSWS